MFRVILFKIRGDRTIKNFKNFDLAILELVRRRYLDVLRPSKMFLINETTFDFSFSVYSCYGR